MLSFKLSCLWSFFPTQGLNPGLLHCGQIPYCLSHQGSPFCHGSPSEYIDIRHRVQEGFVILIICRLRVAQLSLMGCKLLEGRDTEPSSALVLGSLRELPEWVLGSLRELPEWSPGLGLHTCLLKEGWLSGWTDGLKEGDRAQITDSTGRSRGHGHKKTAGQAQHGLGG